MNQEQLENLQTGDEVFAKEDEYDFYEVLGKTKPANEDVMYPLDSREWWGPCWFDSRHGATIYDIDGEWLCDYGEGFLLDVPDGKGFFVSKEEMLNQFEIWEIEP